MAEGEQNQEGKKQEKPKLHRLFYSKNTWTTTMEDVVDKINEIIDYLNEHD